ncbi:hypothetical protein SEVIR_8G172876v4 [Setaria viridis]
MSRVLLGGGVRVDASRGGLTDAFRDVAAKSYESEASPGGWVQAFSHRPDLQDGSAAVAAGTGNLLTHRVRYHQAFRYKEHGVQEDVDAAVLPSTPAVAGLPRAGRPSARQTMGGSRNQV